MASLEEMRKKVKGSDLTLFTKMYKGEELSQEEQDKLAEISYNSPEKALAALEGNEENIDAWWDFMNSPAMLERAEELKKAGRIQHGLETAVGLFNDAYNLYLSGEQIRVGEEELDKVQEANVPKRVQAIPELESALRQARGLGDPGAAISKVQELNERSQLGAIRAAQQGTRGQAGALGAQAQALHQRKLAADAQIPMMARDIQMQGLQAQVPLIGMKQDIDLANRRGDIALFPSLLRRQQSQEYMAGMTSQLGRTGRAQSISNLINQVPSLAGNVYSNQYSTLPPEAASYVNQLF